MRRVLVIGCPGAGKTIFAHRLAERLGLPLVHLDVRYWLPGWQAPAESAWRATVGRLVADPDWVMDGHFPDTFDLRFARADCLIWLDYARATCLMRVLLRLWRTAGRDRADLPAGCPESFDAKLLAYVWRFPRQQRPRVVDAIERFGSALRVLRFRRDGEAEAFLASIETA